MNTPHVTAWKDIPSSYPQGTHSQLTKREIEVARVLVDKAREQNPMLIGELLLAVRVNPDEKSEIIVTEDRSTIGTYCVWEFYYQQIPLFLLAPGRSYHKVKLSFSSPKCKEELVNIGLITPVSYSRTHEGYVSGPFKTRTRTKFYYGLEHVIYDEELFWISDAVFEVLGING